MFEKIAIISEISNAFPEMIKCLGGLKALGAEECLLVQCFNPKEVEAGISKYFDLVAMFEENLKKQKDILEEQGFAVSTRIISGTQKNAINSIVVEEECSLVLINFEKRTMIGALFFNGVANHVINHSSIPVLLVREKRQFEVASGKPALISHVLFPTDFSVNADIAFEYVKEMVKCGLKKVTLAHVQDQSKIEPYLSNRLLEFNQIDQERLQKIKEQLLALGEIDVSLLIPFGMPTAEILKIIREQNISLVVMGTQGRGFVKEVFVGSVSHNIVRSAPTSVLLIPGNRD
jgi:nucleotide-binding universal stress UspA family protein